METAAGGRIRRTPVHAQGLNAPFGPQDRQREMCQVPHSLKTKDLDPHFALILSGNCRKDVFNTRRLPNAEMRSKKIKKIIKRRRNGGLNSVCRWIEAGH